jgi:hypothetical protein
LLLLARQDALADATSLNGSILAGESPATQPAAKPTRDHLTSSFLLNDVAHGFGERMKGGC